MKECSKCREDKDSSQFYKNSKRQDGLQNYCKLCSSKRSKVYFQNNKKAYNETKQRRRKTNRQLVDEIKSTTPCFDCKKLYPPECMDFDHLRDKLANISKLVATDCSWSRIEVEMEKCELVCANCHRIRTFSRY